MIYGHYRWVFLQTLIITCYLWIIKIDERNAFLSLQFLEHPKILIEECDLLVSLAQPGFCFYGGWTEKLIIIKEMYEKLNRNWRISIRGKFFWKYVITNAVQLNKTIFIEKLRMYKKMFFRFSIFWEWVEYFGGIILLTHYTIFNMFSLEKNLHFSFSWLSAKFEDFSWIYSKWSTKFSTHSWEEKNTSARLTFSQFSNF